MRIGLFRFRRAAAALLLACGTAGCGSPAAAPTTSSAAAPAPPPKEFPVDPDGPRFHPVHHAAFGPWYGSGCPTFGDCACDGATDTAEEANCQLDHLAMNDIPISVYLFDGGAWSAAGTVGGSDACTGPDCCSWRLGDEVLQRLTSHDTRALLHYWGGCRQPEQFQRAQGQLGARLLGFYLDDGTSDADLERASKTMQTLMPGDWENVAKAYQVGSASLSDAALTRFANVAYVGDVETGFVGLRQSVDLLLSKAHLVPAPFAEFTGYAPGAPNEEVYRRRLHFGALQPVMAHTPYTNSDPWAPEYSADLVASYRYWAWLHRELVPYFYSYAYRMFETPTALVLRPGPNRYSFLVGEELYVPVVTESVASMDIQLPPGRWINYWDPSRVLSGTLAAFAVPLGAEPIFVRDGALIPLEVAREYAGHGTAESASALTVLVYPSGSSTFRYRADAVQPWVTFTSSSSADLLTLSASPAPSQSVLYRIERWPVAPTTLAVRGGRVLVNQGGTLPRVFDEHLVNGSTASAWFYDAAARRLIVHAVPDERAAPVRPSWANSPTISRLRRGGGQRGMDRATMRQGTE